MSETASTHGRQCAPRRSPAPASSEDLFWLRQELRQANENFKDLTRRHANVIADRDRLRERGQVLADEHGEPDRWEAAIQDHPDPYEVLWEEGPFAGFTVAKAYVLQDALAGHEVIARGFYSEKRGIFQRILLPGSRASTPFCMLYDLEIATSWSGRKCGLSSSWHLGIGAAKRFEVIGPEFGFCDDCCMWVPKEDLMSSPDRPQHMYCRAMDQEGLCL
jgi:hypothetical protein